MNRVRLGVFVFFGLAALAAGVFLIGSRKLAFSSTYRLNAQFQNAAGLVDGADVRVGGIRMGTVRAVELPARPDGQVTVVMELASKTRAVVKKDSVASIQAAGLVGDEYVEVSFGSAGGGAVKDGDTIKSQPPLQMALLFKKADGILDEVQDAAKSLDQSSKSVASISGKINNGSGTVGELINDKSLYQRADAGATALAEDAEALKHNFLLRGFFKDRGYEDVSQLTNYEIPALPAGPYEKDFTLDGKKLFAKVDTAKLRDEKALKPAGQFLQSNPYGLVVVAAFGGAKQDPDQEQQLTLARAFVVRDSLVKNFRLEDPLVKTIGFAKQTEGPDGEVKILIYPQGVK